MSTTADPFDLKRFTSAQEDAYARALSELRRGQKQSHWMWYIFPQLDGLGHSAKTRYYALKSREEARAYLKHPLLGKRLIECAETVLDIEGRSVTAIFGSPDDAKLRSSMTLFAAVSEPDSVFARVLEKFFKRQSDTRTLQLLETR